MSCPRRLRLGALLGTAVAMIASLTFSARPVAAAHAAAAIEITATSGFGRFQGVTFSRHDCRFSGTADVFAYERTDGTTGGVDFDVSCSIVLPDDPGRWNGRILVEPLDRFVTHPPEAGEFTRALLLGDNFLFGGTARRWGYARISYLGQAAGDTVDQASTEPAAGLEILADFAHSLRTGAGSGLVGAGSSHGHAAAVAAVGFSNQAAALRGTMRLWPALGEPFDAALVMSSVAQLVPDADLRTAIGDYGPVDFGQQRALFLNSETEVIANGTIDIQGFVPVPSSIPLRVEADDDLRFVYEVAGAAHLDPLNQADLVANGVVPPGSFADANPLVWAPVIRALFARMDEWLDGGTPPPSRVLDPPPDPMAGDDAYPAHPSVVAALVARDGHLNALGGIRLPEVALGVGTFRAIGAPVDLFGPDLTAALFGWLAGGFEAADCPTGHGGHAEFVSRYRAEARDLVADGFLLQADAAAMIAAAARNGRPGC